MGATLTDNLFAWMLATDHKHQDVREVTQPTFLLCVSKLLRGTITDRSRIMLNLAAHGKPAVGAKELVKVSWYPC